MALVRNRSTVILTPKAEESRMGSFGIALGRCLRMTKESGFVLITSYILIAGLLTTVFSYFSRSFYDFDLAQRRLSRLQALYTAESGAERAIEQMKGTIPVLQPDCGQSNPSTWTPYSNTNLGTEGTYTVRITNDCTSPNQIYWIRSTGTFDNVTREMRLSVRLTNFANYAIASDHMDPDTYFTYPVIVYGPVHINGPIQIYGKLTFDDNYDQDSKSYYGRVTSSASEIYYYNNDTASDGYTPMGGEGSWTGSTGKTWTASRPVWSFEGAHPLLNQPRILFPPPDVSSLKQRAGTQVVNQKMWVRFNGDGTYNYSTSGPITETNLGSSRSMPPKGSVLYFESLNGSSTNQPQVVIRGIVSQDVTIASPQDIGIDGNLRYDCYRQWVDKNTLGNSNSCGPTDPKLTVVSAKNIVHLPEAELDPKTQYGVPGFSMRRNRVLTGSFMALGGGMAVPDPDAVHNSLVADMDTHSKKTHLDVWGSLIEYEMKPKSLLLGGYQTENHLYSERTGFDSTKIKHDRRLDLSSLPLSMSQAVSILSWEACDGPCT